ncbi:hypothetical protein M0813_29725 [Anaeramoeba flamelloides]|uniref:Uncharacterized protein n=1 Tax=Anaeramoeba flamelloides TaxID=1746091 RepID=A0ABQ8XLC5_9EUKA|nr:hypothetical protein M0813_29725 [Anaeramoeba flamelloides]
MNRLLIGDVVLAEIPNELVHVKIDSYFSEEKDLINKKFLSNQETQFELEKIIKKCIQKPQETTRGPIQTKELFFVYSRKRSPMSSQKIYHNGKLLSSHRYMYVIKIGLLKNIHSILLQSKKIASQQKQSQTQTQTTNINKKNSNKSLLNVYEKLTSVRKRRGFEETINQENENNNCLNFNSSCDKKSFQRGLKANQNKQRRTLLSSNTRNRHQFYQKQKEIFDSQQIPEIQMEEK